MDRAERTAVELAWVEGYRPVIEMAAQTFLETGDWPEVQRLQRKVDRLRNGMVVESILQEMPRLPGEMRAYSFSNAILPMRFFKYIPQGRNILPACLSIIQLSSEIWYSDTDPPVLRSDNPDLLRIMPGRAREVWVRAGVLVNSSQPSVLAGGTWGSDFWELNINGNVVRQLPEILTIDDYFDSQVQMMEAAVALRDAALDPLPSGPTQHSVFVLMPFVESWSTPALEIFQSAAQAIDIDPKPHLYRADEIDESDWITDQIMDAIRTADAVLADISDLNPNVMWELGFAQALERPVVVVNQRIQRSPFDVRGWRQVEYAIPPTENQVAQLTRFLSVALGVS